MLRKYASEVYQRRGELQKLIFRRQVVTKI